MSKAAMGTLRRTVPEMAARVGFDGKKNLSALRARGPYYPIRLKAEGYISGVPEQIQPHRLLRRKIQQVNLD